ncbi:hypothetical protein BV898_00570 [Hypsibius exemplaris]|uniref:MFS-type transporter SLC18B1 n=1 Tax=Hypsibius exemplaris TaxID=2072580 RepID=A0A1W0XDS9_HYPEX|nr:hypothetical protein BV898_00570 [Hypsibius exemplaris]
MSVRSGHSGIFARRSGSSVDERSLLLENDNILESSSDELNASNRRAAVRLGRKEILVMVISSSAIFMANVAFGTMPLMLPVEITKKGYSLSWIGGLYLVNGLFLFVFELLQPRLVPVIGTKRVFVISTAGLGAAYFAFGFLQFTNSGTTFGVVGCFIRAAEAIFFAGMMNSGLTMMCLATPDKALILFGVTDGLVVVGFALGPLVAGALYYVSGFTLTFVIPGLLLMFCALWGQFGLPTVSNALRVPGFEDIRRLLADLHFIAGIVLILTVSIAIGSLEATMEIYFSKFELGIVTEGVIFFSGWMAGALTSPFIGWLLTKWRIEWILLVAGPFLVSFFFFIFGIVPALIGLNLGLSIAFLLLLIITTSASFVGGVGIMLRQAESCGLVNDSVTYTFISAVWLSMFYLGEGLGGLISTTILDYYSYEAVSIAYIAIQLALVGCALVILYFANRGRSDSYDVTAEPKGTYKSLQE